MGRQLQRRWGSGEGPETVAIHRFGFVQLALPPHTSGMRGWGGRRAIRTVSGHLGLFPEGQALARFIKWQPNEFSYPLADSCGAEQVRLASAQGGELANSN